jgi:hypothetical protein
MLLIIYVIMSALCDCFFVLAFLFEPILLDLVV